MKPKKLVIGGAVSTFLSGLVDLVLVLILKSAPVYLTVTLVVIGQLLFIGGLLAIIIGLIKLYRLRFN